MKKIFYIFFLALFLILSACKQQDNPTKSSDNYVSPIVNGSFEEIDEENGEIVGWSASGSGASYRNVVKSYDYTKEEDLVKNNGIDDNLNEKVGEYYYNGVAGSTLRLTGSLTSTPFILDGSGVISFKMGAGKNQDLVHIDFIINDVVVYSFQNTDFNAYYLPTRMIRQTVDLSAYLGQEVTIKIVEDDNQTDYSFLTVDDFRVCADEAEVNKYQQERLTQLQKYGPPDWHEDETNTEIMNPSFEAGNLTGWTLLSGEAFSDNNVISTNNYYWSERLVYGVRDYYFDGSNNGTIDERFKGVMRSSRFTLAGDGYLSFMIGGALDQELCYVAICDGKTDEELIKVANQGFNDPNLPLTLLRVYVDASEYLGRVLYYKIVDNNNNEDGKGYAFISVDDFRSSLTKDEVIALENTQLELIQNNSYNDSFDSKGHLLNYYLNYDYLFPLSGYVMTNRPTNSKVYLNSKADLEAFLTNTKLKSVDTSYDVEILEVKFNDELFTTGYNDFTFLKLGVYQITYGATVDGKLISDSFKINTYLEYNVTNGDFEMGNMYGFTLISGDTTINPIDSNKTFFNEQVSLNQGGNYHFDGWKSSPKSEDSTILYRSEIFTLAGTGMISFKLGGRTSRLSVYKETGEKIAIYENYNFHEDDRLLVGEGCYEGTMLSYYDDLSSFLGEKIYIEIEDFAMANVSWRIAFFDDINFYYPEEVDFTNKRDLIQESNNGPMIELPYFAGINLLVPHFVVVIKPSDLTVGVNETINLDAHIATALVKFGEEDVLLKIKNVIFQETEYTGDFTAFTFTESGTYLVNVVATNQDGKEYALSFNVIVKADLNANNIYNGDFETGNLEGWSLIKGDINLNEAVSSASSFWNERISYNQGGNYHFDGWCATTIENNGYALRSTSFTLAGSGFITFKMGGNAAKLKVYKDDGTLIAKYNNYEFADKNFPFIGEGSRLATMTTYYADLSKYKGEKLYIVIEDDESTNGWAVAFFDDINCYYAEDIDFKAKYDTTFESNGLDTTVKLYYKEAINVIE